MAGSSDDEVRPRKNTATNRPTGFDAMRLKKTSEAIKEPKPTNMVRVRLRSAAHPPMRLPRVMPTPRVASTHGTMPGPRPVSRVVTSAMYE